MMESYFHSFIPETPVVVATVFVLFVLVAAIAGRRSVRLDIVKLSHTNKRNSYEYYFAEPQRDCRWKAAAWLPRVGKKVSAGRFQRTTAIRLPSTFSDVVWAAAGMIAVGELTVRLHWRGILQRSINAFGGTENSLGLAKFGAIICVGLFVAVTGSTIFMARMIAERRQAQRLLKKCRAAGIAPAVRLGLSPIFVILHTLWGIAELALFLMDYYREERDNKRDNSKRMRDECSAKKIIASNGLFKVDKGKFISSGGLEVA